MYAGEREVLGICLPLRDGGYRFVHVCRCGRTGFGIGRNKNHPQENADAHWLFSEGRGCQ